jgi:hypothetical protein
VAGDPRPVGGRDYPRTDQEFRSWFPTSGRGRKYLAGLPSRGLLFYRLLQQAAGTDPHPLSELIGGTGNDWDEPTDD